MCIHTLSRRLSILVSSVIPIYTHVLSTIYYPSIHLSSLVQYACMYVCLHVSIPTLDCYLYCLPCSCLISLPPSVCMAVTCILYVSHLIPVPLAALDSREVDHRRRMIVQKIHTIQGIIAWHRRIGGLLQTWKHDIYPPANYYYSSMYFIHNIYASSPE